MNKPVGKVSPSAFPPSSQAKTPGSLPVLTALNDGNIPNGPPPVRPPSLAGPKAPVKRSVGNTGVFVSINGSPVRIHKPGSGGHEVKKIKQRSIGDLLNAANSGKPAAEPSTSNREKASATSVSPYFSPPQSNHAATLPRSSQHGPNAKGSPAKATQPNASQASRKRPLDDRQGSATIYDFFQRTSSGDSASAVLPSARPSSSSPSSSSTSSFPAPTPSSSSSSSAPFAVMVNCPACRAKVQESKINEHLDSCLS